MTSEKSKKAVDKAVLSYMNLSNHYERKARLLPGLLCAMALVPVAVAYGTPLGDWIGLVATGLGLWAVCGVGLSHASSAAGNRFQEKLWPRWPYYAPTHRWLHPEDRTASAQQKKLANEAIKRLTRLDLEAAVDAGPDEVEAVLNDCITRLRHRLRGSEHADRLDVHNADYGFARNLAGLRPIWLTFLALSTIGCWFGYFRYGHPIMWSAIATILFAVGILCTLTIGRYVRVRARHYTDSFFSAVLELDIEESKASPAASAAPSNAQEKKPSRKRSTEQKAKRPT